MKGKLFFKLWALTTILSVLLVVPALGQEAQTNEELGKQLKEYKAQTFDQLKFTADQKKTLLAIEDKYSVARGKIMEWRRRLRSSPRRAARC